jgi:hypothetical protein
VVAPGAESLGDGEYHLPLRNCGEESFFQPEGPERQAFDVATGAEVPALAGEGEQIFVRASVAAHAGKAVVEDTAGEEPVGDLAHYGAPVTIGVGKAILPDRVYVREAVLHESEQWGRARASGLVDASWRIGGALAATGARFPFRERGQRGGASGKPWVPEASPGSG